MMTTLPKPYYASEDGTIVLYHCRAEDLIDQLADGSVALVATDPPYHRVKDDAWDREHKSADAFLAWVGDVAAALRRPLALNGSLYWFCSSKLDDGVSWTLRQHFNVLNRIKWRKEEGRHKGMDRDTLRAYFDQTEVIIFAEQFGADSNALAGSGYESALNQARGFVFEPLRAYLDGERQRCGITNKEIEDGMAARTGRRYVLSRHAFHPSQWELPTREQYEAARDLFNEIGHRNGRGADDFLKREYDELKREYETLRRPFAILPDVPYTDSWDFPTVQWAKGKHPCEKPVPMMMHIIQTSSRPGDVVLDPFFGSGATPEAALRLGRSFIGCDMDERWVAYTAKRLEAVAREMAEHAAMDLPHGWAAPAVGATVRSSARRATDQRSIFEMLEAA